MLFLFLAFRCGDVTLSTDLIRQTSPRVWLVGVVVRFFAPKGCARQSVSFLALPPHHVVRNHTPPVLNPLSTLLATAAANHKRFRSCVFSFSCLESRQKCLQCSPAASSSSLVPCSLASPRSCSAVCAAIPWRETSASSSSTPSTSATLLILYPRTTG
jgi:hypothetical protein